MRLFRLTLIGFFLGAASLGAAQETKPTAQEPRSDSSAKPPEQKTEFERANDELKRRGERVLTFCGEDGCKDSKEKIGAAVINGNAIELVQPPYPAIARTIHASGRVEVLVIIDKEGNVMAAEVQSGHPLLMGAAYKAAKASRFTPTTVEGKPVHVLGKLIYNFVAQ